MRSCFVLVISFIISISLSNQHAKVQISYDKGAEADYPLTYILQSFKYKQTSGYFEANISEA